MKKGLYEHMLKGKSTIELFDGITGKKVEEHINENLATNAIQSLLNIGSEQLMAGMRMDILLDSLSPLYPHYLRGILLWDSAIPENPNIIYAPPGVRCVGHAGGVYSGGKVTRGTLNTNETRVSPNGAKIVWDFGTDKANGTVRSVSLSSIQGGDAGWMTPFESGAVVITRPNINAASAHPSTVTIVPTSLTATGTFHLAGELRRGIYTFVAVSGNNLTIIEKRYTNPAQIGIFNKMGNITATNASETTFTVESNAPFDNFTANFIIEGDNLVHVSLSGTGNRNARIRTINLITKTITSDRVITLSENVSTSPAAFFKERLVVRRGTGGETAMYDENGQFVRVLSTHATSGVMRRHSCIGGYLIGGLTANTFFITDGINSQAYSSSAAVDSNEISVINSASVKLPLFVNGGNTVGFLPPYMATINNLSTPVEKNNLNTMKITYDLTQI
ncbi:MAG: hypothetical protein LBC82_08995 [Oscillospiraceae bacterium]|jgi:hypothetical protein|nr:hypothetical protein [Oscillospiraceae bacterium]